MKTETFPCKCGEGTITHVMEMDDWNRTRSYREIHCPKCREADERRREDQYDREEKCRELYDQARQLAAGRYIDQWLASYSSLTKKQAWERYTGGSGYPSLGTFYKHVQHSGSVEKYLRWCFGNHFEDILRGMAITDVEIEELLRQRKTLESPVPL